MRWLGLMLALSPLSGCARGAEPEEICAHTDALFEKESSALIAESKPLTPERKARVDKVMKEREARQKDCPLTYRQIKDAVASSKWKAFSECHLGKTTVDQLADCAPLLGQ